MPVCLALQTLVTDWIKAAIEEIAVVTVPGTPLGISMIASGLSATAISLVFYQENQVNKQFFCSKRLSWNTDFYESHRVNTLENILKSTDDRSVVLNLKNY